jgi:siderophore synthetase component
VSASAKQYLRAVLEGEAERVRTAAQGSRNNALNLASYLLGQLVGSGEIAEQEARSVLEEAASVHLSVDGFNEREMHQTIRSGLTAGMRKPRYLTRQPRRGADA